GALGLAYAALAVGCGLAAARKQGLACAFTLPFIFVTIHTSYGLGFLQGVAHHLLGLGRRPRDAATLALTRSRATAMPLRLRCTRIADWPPLAWLARCPPSDREIDGLPGDPVGAG